MVWIYNPVARPGNKLVFSFKDATGVIQYTFDYYLDYSGWRRAVRRYIDMNGSKTATTIASVVISAPTSGSGQLFIDSVTWNGANTYAAVYDGQNHAGATSYSRPYYDLTPDIPLTAPTAEDLAGLAALRAAYNPGSPGDMTATNQSWADLNIAASGPNDWQIKSNILSPVDDPAWVQTLGKDVYQNHSQSSIDKMNLFARTFLDQGGAGGSESLQPPMVQTSWDLGKGMAFANRNLDPALQSKIWDSLRWGYQFGKYWDIPGRPCIGMTSFDEVASYYSSSISDYMKVILFAPTSDAETLRYIKGFNRYYADWTLAPTVGKAGGVKIDGCGFHHNAEYPAYMTGLDLIMSALLQMRYPGFMTQTGYKNLRNVMLSQMRQGIDSGTGGNLPNSLCGRRPFGFGMFFNNTHVQQLGMLGGVVLGLSGPDPVVAKAYNSMWPNYPYAPFAPYGNDVDGKGFYQFNYAALGVYRHDNWVAGMRGLHNFTWGSEIYIGYNYYGRYQSSGVCEILYPGGLTASGMGGNGWDWNRPPGGTTEVLPWTSFYIGRTDESQEGNFSGSLAFRGDGNLSGGQAGIWTCNLTKGVGWHGYWPSLMSWKKTDFCFDNCIIRVATDISVGNATNTNPIATTIFQGKLVNTNTPIVKNGTSITDFPYASTDNDNTADWLLDSYGTGYYIQPGNVLRLSRSLQSSPVHDNTTPSDSNTFVSGNYSKAWLDHGTNPSGNSYEYVIMPNTNASSMTSMAEKFSNPMTSPYEVLQKNSSAHVVHWKPDNTIGYSFFDSGNVGPVAAAVGPLRSVSQRCLVMTRPNPSGNLWLTLVNPELTLADPWSGPALAAEFFITLAGQWAMVGNTSNAIVSERTAYRTTIKITVTEGQPANLELQGSTITPSLLVASNDSANAVTNTDVTINVTSNDFDVNNQTFTVVSITQPSHGSSLINGSSTLKYTSSSGFSGSDQFTYTIKNASGQTSTATVYINVISASDPASGLLGWYQFNEGVGLVATDSSDRGNHGNLINGPTWTTGTSGGGLLLDGSNDYVSLPTSGYSGLSNEISIAFWSYGDASKLPRSNCILYATDASGNRVLNIHLGWADNNIYWDAGNSGGSAYDRLQKVANAADFKGKWSHWVFTKNAATGAMTIYLNGVSWATGTAKTKIFPSTLASLTLGGGNSLYYPGMIDEVRIYNRALTLSQVQQLATTTPPAITSQPSAQLVNAGTPVTFSATVSGTPPMICQWRKNGTSIAGATSTSYTIPSTSENDAGNYSMTVSNTVGAATSAMANLMVLQAPVIVSQPISQTVLLGSDVTLSATMTGTPIFTYQWFKNGAPIVGANDRNLTLTSLIDSNAGDYHLVVSNAVGTATSNIATITINSIPPSINCQPNSCAITTGSNAVLNVLVSGTIPISYQWQSSQDGVTWSSIPAANSSSLTYGPVKLEDHHRLFRCQATNSVGTVTSNVASLYVGTALWTNPLGGSWPTPTNWLSSFVPNGNDLIADFSTLDLTADAVVTLDGTRAVGGLIFGDISPSHNWTILPGPTGNLNLATTGQVPIITVNNQTATIKSSISCQIGFIKSGNGTLCLSGTNTFDGGVIVESGTLKLLGDNSGYSQIGLGKLIINSNATVEANSNNALGQTTGYALSPLIINGGTFLADSINQINTITLNGGNIGIRSGVTQVDGISLITRYNLPTLTTISNTSSSTILSKITLINNSIFNIADGDASVDLLISGPIVGSGSLKKTGNGTLVLNGSNNYVGGTIISGGVMRIATSNNLGRSILLTLDGGTLSATNGFSLGCPIWVGLSGGTVEVAEGQTLSISNQDISGTGTFHKSGLGALELSGAKSISSGINLDAGTLSYIGGGNVLGAGILTLADGVTLNRTGALTESPSTRILANGNFTLTGVSGGSYTGNIDLGAGNRTITVNTENVTFSGVFSNGGLCKTGPGAMTICGNNTYSSDTSIISGTMILGANDVIPDGIGKGNVLLSGTLNLNGFNDTINGLIGSGSVIGTGCLTINGSHQPGKRIGIQTFAGMLTYGNTSHFNWDLAANSNTVADSTFDQVAANSVMVTPGAVIDINLTEGEVNFTQPFWTQAHVWPVITANAISGAFALGSVSRDAYGNLMLDYGKFSLEHTNVGVHIVWSPNTAYHQWQVKQFVDNWNNETISGDTMDADGDGIVNLIEYAVGSNPNLQNIGPTSGIIGNLFTLSFTHNTAANDITITVQGTDSLNDQWTNLAKSINGGSFTPLMPGIHIDETGDGIIHDVQLQDASPATDSTHSRRFLRLQVTH